MARQTEFYSLYTAQEIENTLTKAKTKPFYLYYDKPNGVYRHFNTEEDCKQWVSVYEADGLSDANALDLEFTESFIAPAPYTININSLKDNLYILYGTTGTTLSYGFKTVDGNSNEVSESVEVFYTFSSTSGSKTDSNIYNAGTTVEKVIDDFLELGTNTITIFLRGRSTGTTKTVVVTYYVVKLSLSSTFDISRAILPGKNFSVTYTVEGEADKTVQFYLNGTLVSSANVSSLESSATRTQVFSGTDANLKTGKNTLLIRANMMAGDQQFYSNLLFYEFVITGDDLTTTLIQETFPNTQQPFVGSLPGLSGEQYVTQQIDWAYYSSDLMKQTATVTWRLYTAAGVETPLATRNADVVQGEVDKKPDPLNFMPTETGNYELQALVNGEVISSYTIAVIANTNGLIETTEGMTMKLSGLGRSNEEPSDTLTSWADRGYSCTFFNMPFNGNAGYVDDAVVFNNGATGLINNKPFSDDIAVTSNNGNVVEVDFETFNIDDDSAVLFRIGNTDSGPCLTITGNKATLKSRLGKTITKLFKSDERVKIAFITYPNTADHATYPCMMFIQCNGVLAPGVQYDQTDSFTIGEAENTSDTYGMINIGNADSKGGIKIYYLRTYNTIYTQWLGLNNYTIDSGEDLTSMVNKNDIFLKGTADTIDVNKLEAKIPLLKLTTDINPLIATQSKTTVYAVAEYTDPENPDRYFTGSSVELSNAGQSTLGLHMSPSMHMKFDKNNNVLYDRDGNPWVKNRWTFDSNNVPEKKIRLQANPMDSSCCHNGSFLKMVNKIYPNVKIDGEYVLRTPIQEYVLSGQYSTDMASSHGGEAKDYAFPYTINFVPDSKAITVVWRKNENSSYEMLGQYLMMEEKNANYANGMHSIYDKLDANEDPDPFDFLTGQKGNKLHDNEGDALFENLRNHQLTLFTGTSQFSDTTERQLAYEKEFPDDDDLTETEIESSWLDFYTTLLKPIADTYGNQTAFDSVVWEHVNIYYAAAYYCLVMRQCCTDSLVRNLEWTRYGTDGKWIPKWWDVDMQLGLLQSGACDAEPMTDRDTMLNGDYVLSGRDNKGNSSWFWDAAEKNTLFKAMVTKMDQALYDAGWTYEAITTIQDGSYVDKWGAASYNKDGYVKYLSAWLSGYDYLTMFQGDRTSHRHWFERTSYDYWDAKRAVGEYRDKAIYIRARGAKKGDVMKFVAGATSYFGWGQTQDIIETGIYAKKGESFNLSVLSEVGLVGNDPVQIYAANKIQEADFSGIARYIWSTIQLDKCYDSVTGTLLKKLILGISKTDMNTYSSIATEWDDEGNITKTELLRVLNYQTNIGFTGLNHLTRLEYLDIQGYEGLSSIDLSYMTNLKYFYAAGSGLVTFNPADGADLDIIELPTTITSMTMNGVDLTSTSGDSAITWWDITTQTTCPKTLSTLRLIGMGSNVGTHKFLHEWLQSIKDDSEALENALITYTSIDWEDITIEDLLTLTKIPKAQRTLTGYVKCTTEYTVELMNTLMKAFGDSCFTKANAISGLCCDCNSSNIIVSASGDECTVAEDGTVEILQGTSATLQAVGFPIKSDGVTYQWYVFNSSSNDYTTGNSDSPNITFGENTLHYTSGVINTTECTTADTVYKIYVQSSVGGEGTINIKIKKREYPTIATISYRSSQSSVSYDGSTILLSSVGHYIFDVTHTPEGYTGNMINTNGGVWSVDGLTDTLGIRCEADYTSGNDENTEYCLNIKKLPDEETTLTMKYTSYWKGGSSVKATDYPIIIISNILGILTSSSIAGNPALFNAINALGISHVDDYSFSSMELKLLRGTLDLSGITALTKFTSGSYNVLHFLKNVTNVIADNTGLDRDVDLLGSTWLTSFSCKGTGVNVPLDSMPNMTKLSLGSPSNITINNCPKLNINNVICNSFEYKLTSITLSVVSNNIISTTNSGKLVVTYNEQCADNQKGVVISLSDKYTQIDDDLNITTTSDVSRELTITAISTYDSSVSGSITVTIGGNLDTE